MNVVVENKRGKIYSFVNRFFSLEVRFFSSDMKFRNNKNILIQQNNHLHGRSDIYIRLFKRLGVYISYNKHQFKK
jgi:hypothetical protein